MKKLIYLFCIISLNCCSQNTSFNFGQKYDNLITELGKENWSKSFDLCKELLVFSEDKENYISENENLRYIYIYTIAGLLNEKKITKDEALKSVKFLLNKELITATHPYLKNTILNATHIDDKEKDVFFTCSTNKIGTQIFSFEYAKITDGIKEKEEELEGKQIQIRAKLSEINIEGNMLPRFKIKFSEGQYRILE